MADQNEELKEFTLGKFNNGDPNLLAPNTYIEKDGEMVPAPGVGLPEGTTLETEESKLAKQPTVQVSGTQTTTPVVTETPETKPAYNPDDYLVDWGKMTPKQAYDLKQHSINDLMYDQQKWAKATGNDFNWFPWAGISKDQDINKTQAENEEDERKAKAKARWDSIGRFIRELGNFVGVAGFGGQSIPSKEASPEEYTARQKQLRDATIAARNAYNKNFFAQLTAQQNAERQKELNDANIALREQQRKASEADVARKDAESKATIELKGKQGARYDEQTQTEKVLRPLKVESEKARTTASRASASASFARANATNRQSYGHNYNNHRFDILAENLDSYPDEAKQFMDDHNIHGRDKKDWTNNQVDQFNAEMALKKKRGKVVKKPATTKSASTSTSKDKYSQYKVNKQ